MNEDLRLGLLAEQLEVILSDDITTYATLKECGVDDTETKGQLVDLVANAFMGRSWPTYAEKINIDEFTEELKLQIQMIPKGEF